MSASSSPLLTVFWDELLFTGCWVFGRWQKVSKTKFSADASRTKSAYILKASTENFAKVQYLKTRTEVMMDPITRQLKKDDCGTAACDDEDKDGDENEELWPT